MIVSVLFDAENQRANDSRHFPFKAELGFAVLIAMRTAALLIHHFEHFGSIGR
jgi:hypothetical protein